MMRSSTQGFDLIRKYIQAEEAKNKETEKMLDRMKNPKNLLSDTDAPLAEFTSLPEDQSREVLSRYKSWQQKSLRLDPSSLKVDDSSARQIASLRGQMSRLLADTSSSSSSSSTSSPTAAGYSPNYEGVFIITPISLVQTRLFDYIDLLGEDDHVETGDIDRDGDRDYIFLL